jgi:hypothetical protein
VDDLIILKNNTKMIKDLKGKLHKSFEMTDLGMLHYCLGVQVWQIDDGIFMSHTKYAQQILRRFNKANSKSVATPLETGMKLSTTEDWKYVDGTLHMQLVGNLMIIYLTTTKLDLSYALWIVSQFMASPKDFQWKEATRILQ